MRVRAAELATIRELLRRKLAHDPTLIGLGLDPAAVRSAEHAALPAHASMPGLVLVWPTPPTVYEHVLVVTLRVRVCWLDAAAPPRGRSTLLDHIGQALRELTPHDRPLLRVVPRKRGTEGWPDEPMSVDFRDHQVLARRADPGPRPSLRVVIPARRHRL